MYSSFTAQLAEDRRRDLLATAERRAVFVGRRRRRRNR